MDLMMADQLAARRIRRRRLAALMMALTTMPGIAFALVRTFTERPSYAVPVAADAISVEGDHDEAAVLPDELAARLSELDERRPENPYVRLNPAPFVATNPAELGMRWPVGDRHKVTSPFGPRSRGFHHGLDIGCPTGEPILAVAAGTVVWTGEAPVYGNMVVVHHGHGSITLYAHLSRFAVAEGDHVSKSQPLGACGSTGFSTGPHLHLEVRYGGRAWDPLRFLP